MTADRPRLVVGLDGSPGSVAALRWAVAEAQYRRADVDVVACWYPPLVAEARGYQVGLLGCDDYAAVLRQTLDSALEDIAPDVEAAGADGRAVTGRLLEGAPGATLVSESKNATIVVVGRHGRRSLGRLLLGSVSRHVADHAECPVVVVPPTAGQAEDRVTTS